MVETEEINSLSAFNENVIARRVFMAPPLSSSITGDIGVNHDRLEDRLLNLRTLDHVEGNVGGSIWAASVAAAAWVGSDEGAAVIAGRSVLELGSGVGLGGLACLKWGGATHVTLSDWNRAAPALIANLRVNLQGALLEPTLDPLTVLELGPGCIDPLTGIAGISGIAEVSSVPVGPIAAATGAVALLDWADAMADDFVPAATYHTVLACDVVYGPDINAAASLAAAIRKHLKVL